MPQLIRLRVDLKGWALALTVAVVTLAALEGAAAAWSAYRRTTAFVTRDPALGWRAAAGRQVALDAAGRQFTTDRHGWRRYDAPTSRPLLLVLGDSYTHAVGVSDGAVYYDTVARRLHLAVAALGVNGYGTVQELLVAREAARDILRPAAVLLQLADNDPINNSLALERRSFVNNNLLPRPYLDDDGGVRMEDPRRLHERFVLGRELTRRVLTWQLPTVETAIEGGDPAALDLYRRELRHTARALRLLREVFPDSFALAFNVGGSSSRIGRDLERLAREAGFAYVDIAPRFGEQAAGKSVIQSDGAHWNELGHAIAGGILAEALAASLTPSTRP